MGKFVFWATVTTWTVCMVLAAIVIVLNHRSADGTEIGTAFLWLDVASTKS